MAKSNPHDTPAMRQFRAFKDKHPDCILLFRMGDFYELFYDDAVTISKALGLTLTQRTEGIPMAGMPHHQLDTYLRRLIAAGFRVAVADQVEDPAQAKGVVKRDITRVVTPGTLTDDALLDAARENPLAAVQFHDDHHAALAYAELSTGSFHIATLTTQNLTDELARIAPSELLYVETADNKPPDRVAALAKAADCALTPRPAWQFRPAEAHETLTRQFAVNTLEGFGLSNDHPTVGPAGAVVAYLLETQQATDGRLPHLGPPRLYQQQDHLVIDATSLRALEVEQTMRTGQRAGSLLATLDDCKTPMGKRLLRHWLCFPLRNLDEITHRQDMVAALTDDPIFSDDLTKTLADIQDIQRICARIAIGRPSPRDIVAAGASINTIQTVRDLLQSRPAFDRELKTLTDIADPLHALAQTIATACVEAPPAHLREGGLIADGYDKQLDEYRSLQRDANTYLADYQAQLSESTSIPNLKLGYNKVFGYYIEVSHANTAKVPPEFTRKQTLKNAERYITPELKEFENKVLGAQSKAIAREQELFNQLVTQAADQLTQLQTYAQTLAALDVIACFARTAVKHRYTRPTLTDAPILHITDGRHPVLDQLLADQFVPNDVHLTNASTSRDRQGAVPSNGSSNPASLALITGPNMAGKSTYIRQTALLTLLAHTGSFLPAASATVGLTDRIFTRIGASDELHTGQSTFMVEMVETANICHHATPHSLVILDEIGRGTSTYDGLSLAWAITEHLAQTNCRTLFATHYHELTALADSHTNIANLNVTVREWKDTVVFLHRITPGGTDRSYGIHVAKIAGIPDNVINRARDLIHDFEAPPAPTVNGAFTPPPMQPDDDADQLGLFTEYVEHPAIAELRDADLDNLSPLAAFDLLRKLKNELED